MRPLGGSQNIYEYESVGIYNEDRLSLNYNLRFKKRYFLYGYLRHVYDKTDDNNGGFPSNSYDLAADYGRTANIATNQLNLGAGLDLPFGFSTLPLSPRVQWSPVQHRCRAGSQRRLAVQRPSRLRHRPHPPVGRQDCLRQRSTRVPIAGQTIIPVNYGTGPGFVAVNMTVGRDFNFGPANKSAVALRSWRPARSRISTGATTLNLSADAQNLFNHPNLAPPVGTLNSPLFGRSIALATTIPNNTANRIVSLQAYLRF